MFQGVRINGSASEGWPVKGHITGTFAQNTGFWKNRKPHSGLDIAAPEGTPVYAPAGGIWEPCPFSKAFGIWAMINHDNKLWSIYAHLSERIDKPWGARIKAGEIIGKVGATGQVTGAHVHWGASTKREFLSWYDGTPLVDPLSRLAPEKKRLDALNKMFRRDTAVPYELPVRPDPVPEPEPFDEDDSQYAELSRKVERLETRIHRLEFELEELRGRKRERDDML